MIKGLMADGKSHNILFPEEKERMKAKLEQDFTNMLHHMRLNVSHPHLQDTPARMAKMFVDEVYAGLYTEPPKLTVFPNTRGDQAGMVFLGNIDIFSCCSHHFKDFVGKAHIAYIPGEWIVGISKLARIADWFARRPQVQEELTDGIADYLMQELKPQGVGVSIQAVHNCIRVRGAKQSESEMITTALRGTMLSDKTQADEFYRNMKRIAHES